MKIRLKKSFPQIGMGKVIPAGVVIDAPPGLAERLVREGIGIPANAEPAPQSTVATPKKGRSGKGRGKRNNG